MLGHADVDDRAALEREDHETVEHAEAQAHDGEEIARPDLGQVIAQEGRPGLAATPTDVAWPIFADGARRNDPSEFAALGGYDPLAPERVLSPHSANQRAQFGRNRRATGRPFRSPPPHQRQVARCQPSSVAGLTIAIASRSALQPTASADRKRRSHGFNRGRRAVRRRMMSCWRSSRFSATSRARGASNSMTATMR